MHNREDPDVEAAMTPRRLSGARKISGAVMIGMGRALGEIYDPRPPRDVEITQEASDDEPLPDELVRLELADTPAGSIARVRRPSA